MEKIYYYIFDGAPDGGQVSLTFCQPLLYLRSNIPLLFVEKFYYYIFDGAPGGGQVGLTLRQPTRYLRSNIFHCYSWKSSTTTYVRGHWVEAGQPYPLSVTLLSAQ
jgi:hypothetical protein